MLLWDLLRVGCSLWRQQTRQIRKKKIDVFKKKKAEGGEGSMREVWEGIVGAIGPCGE